MNIIRIFDDKKNLDDIINAITTDEIDKNFKTLLDKLPGQAPIENTSKTDYTVTEKIDCVAHTKGGTHK